MRRIKANVLADGPGPSEKVVSITTSTGLEEVILHSSTLDPSNRMEVGLLGFDDSRALVELPRESASGKWRVWVEQSELS